MHFQNKATELLPTQNGTLLDIRPDHFEITKNATLKSKKKPLVFGVQKFHEYFVPHKYFVTNFVHFQKLGTYTAQKMKFSITDFFSKCDQILSKLRIQSQLLNKSVMENFIFFCSDTAQNYQSSLPPIEWLIIKIHSDC